jgi:hypothetical protein
VPAVFFVDSAAVAAAVAWAASSPDAPLRGRLGRAATAEPVVAAAAFTGVASAVERGALPDARDAAFLGGFAAGAFPASAFANRVFPGGFAVGGFAAGFPVGGFAAGTFRDGVFTLVVFRAPALAGAAFLAGFRAGFEALLRGVVLWTAALRVVLAFGATFFAPFARAPTADLAAVAFLVAFFGAAFFTFAFFAVAFFAVAFFAVAFFAFAFFAFAFWGEAFLPGLVALAGPGFRDPFDTALRDPDFATFDADLRLAVRPPARDRVARSSWPFLAPLFATVAFADGPFRVAAPDVSCFAFDPDPALFDLAFVAMVTSWAARFLGDENPNGFPADDRALSRHAAPRRPVIKKAFPRRRSVTVRIWRDWGAAFGPRHYSGHPPGPPQIRTAKSFGPAPTWRRPTDQPELRPWHWQWPEFNGSRLATHALSRDAVGIGVQWSSVRPVLGAVHDGRVGSRAILIATSRRGGGVRLRLRLPAWPP